MFHRAQMSQDSNGAKLDLYTAVGASITVRGEDVFISQIKPSMTNVVRYQVVPASLRKARLRRSLLQTDDESSVANLDASAAVDCGEGNVVLPNFP